MKRVSGGVDDGFGERGGVVGVRAWRAQSRSVDGEVEGIFWRRR